MPALIDWDASLPQTLLVEGALIGTPDGRLRSPMDKGAGKVRLLSTTMVAPLHGNMYMTQAQLDFFLDTFIPVTLGGGTLEFNFVHPRNEVSMIMRLGEEMPTAAFVSADKWLVTIDFEVMP